MMKLSSYGEFYINCDTEFESTLINTVVDAYDLGAKQKLAEVRVLDYDCDYVRIEATDRGKAIFEHLLAAVKKQLDEHDKYVKQQAIEEYKKANNIK